MKAAVLHEPGDIRVEEIVVPEPAAGWVRLRVLCIGICGTDKAFYRGSYRPLKLPIIPGHEIAGVVDSVGEGVDTSLVGRRVTTEINVYCGRCWYCRNGMPTHCPYRETIGISRDGGMAEYMVTRADLLHSVEGLSDAEAALVEPLAAVVEMAEMKPPSEGSRIAVLGIGTIGLLSIRYLRLFNPDTIVAVSRPGSPKAGLALRSGADAVLTYSEALEYMRKHTPEGQGFDYVVEATGSREGLEMAINLVRPRGVVAAKSTHGSPVSFNYTLFIVKEALLVGSRCGPFEKAIELIKSGKLRVSDLVTHTYRLEEIREAFEKSFERDSVKVQIIP